MLRKKVLNVGDNSATLLVEDTTTKELKVLKRVNIASWHPTEVDDAVQLFTSLSQHRIPVLVDVESVVCQNSFLNIVTAYYNVGSLQTFLKLRHQDPPSDEEIAKWVHVIALALQSVHRLGFVHASIRLDGVFMSEDKGAAGIVVGLPQPLPMYRAMIDAARKKLSSSSCSNAMMMMGGGAAGGTNSANVSILSLELNFPPEALHDVFYYDSRSDIWHLGAVLMSLCSAHQKLHTRSSAMQHLVNEMCDDDPAQRPTIDVVLQRLQALYARNPPPPSSVVMKTATKQLAMNDDVGNTIDTVLDPREFRTRNSTPSPDPHDPSQGQRGRGLHSIAATLVVPRKKPVQTGLKGLPRDGVETNIERSELPVGMVVTPRSTPVGGGDGGGVPPVSRQRQRTPNMTTAVPRSRSKPVSHLPSSAASYAHTTAYGAAAAPTTAAVPTTNRNLKNAQSNFLQHALDREAAEAQRRKEEFIREQNKRREEQLKQSQAAYEAHKQHATNLRKIGKTTHHNRDDIRRSIRVWQQQQQQTFDDDSGVVVRTGKTSRAGGDDDEEHDEDDDDSSLTATKRMAMGTEDQTDGSSRPTRSGPQPVVFDITPPRLRRGDTNSGHMMQQTAVSSVTSHGGTHHRHRHHDPEVPPTPLFTAVAAMSCDHDKKRRSEVEEEHEERERPLSLSTSRSNTATNQRSPAKDDYNTVMSRDSVGDDGSDVANNVQQNASPARGGNLSADRRRRGSNDTHSRLTKIEETSPTTPQQRSSPAPVAAQQVSNKTIDSNAPAPAGAGAAAAAAAVHGGVVDVATVAALEYTADALYKSLIKSLSRSPTTHIDSILHTVRQFVELPVSERVTEHRIIELSLEVRKHFATTIRESDHDTTVEAVTAIALQLAAVHAVLSLSASLGQ